MATTKPPLIGVALRVLGFIVHNTSKYQEELLHMQMVLMPLLARVINEEKILAIGLIFNCVHNFLYSVAWASWVVYFAATFQILAVFAGPSLRSIVSKQVGPTEQGKAQGCITGLCSFASIVSPLIFSPLTALFLSDNAPFMFPGFSLVCAAFL